MLFWLMAFMENSAPLHTWGSLMVTWLDEVAFQVPSNGAVLGCSYLTQLMGTQ